MCIRILGSDPKQIAYIRVRGARLRTAGRGQMEAGVPGRCSLQVKTWRRAAAHAYSSPKETNEREMGEERTNGRKKKERAYVLFRAVWILGNAVASLPPRSVAAARRRERWAGRSAAGGRQGVWSGGPSAGWALGRWLEMQLCNEGEGCSEGKRGAQGARGGGSLRDGDESGAAEAQFASRVKRVEGNK